MHPQYGSGTNFNNDFCLLKVSTPVNFRNQKLVVNTHTAVRESIVSIEWEGTCAVPAPPITKIAFIKKNLPDPQIQTM